MAKYKAKKSETTQTKKEKIKKEKIKKERYVSDNELEIRKFIYILLGILAVIGVIYLLTSLVKGKTENTVEEETSQEVEISYDVVNVGMIFNRPYNNYYVMVYDSEDPNASYYASVLSHYVSFNNSTKIYYCDLGNGLNSSHKSDSELGNKEAKSIDELSFGQITLLEISNKKITKYIEGIENIQKHLQ